MATLYLTAPIPPTPAAVAAVVGVASTAVTVTSTRGLYHRIDVEGLDDLTQEQKAAIIPVAAPRELSAGDFAARTGG